MHLTVVPNDALQPPGPSSWRATVTPAWNHVGFVSRLVAVKVPAAVVRALPIETRWARDVPWLNATRIRPAASPPIVTLPVSRTCVSSFPFTDFLAFAVASASTPDGTRTTDCASTLPAVFGLAVAVAY